MSLPRILGHVNDHGEYALAAAGAMLLACLLLRPSGLAANDGLSYFGGFLNTAVPYSFSFLLYAYFLWRVAPLLATSLGSKDAWAIVLALRVMSGLLVGLVLTPHTLVNGIHTVFGTALFASQLLFSIYLFVRQRDWQNGVILLVQLASGLAALYYLPKHGGLLLQSQVMFQLAFGLLLRRVAMARPDKATL